MIKIFICMTYDDYTHGDIASTIYLVDHDDEDKEYCDFIREACEDSSLTDKEILENSTDVWEIREIE